MTTLNLGSLDGRVMLFGGPYSNLQATQSIRQEARRLGISPENIICNGDIVAYCGQPEETVSLIRDWGVHVVMGNCEEALAQNQDDCGCGFEENTTCSLLSIEWYRFASQHVSTDSRQWMNNLPRNIRFQYSGLDFSVIHGGVENISEFVFESSSNLKKHAEIRSAEANCIIGGHCGLPFGQHINSGYWLNTGVIGMPANDGTQNGWYLLLQPDAAGILTASWHPLTCDMPRAAQLMADAGLGPAYREALVSGIWPSMDVLPEAERKQQGLVIAPDSIALVASASKPFVQSPADVSQPAC